MCILSIQSHVAYGHVGNSAAVFPLQLMGLEVWPIHTVQFSNHTGYGSWTGQVFDAGVIDELVRGITERGVLKQCKAVLSGYMGSAAIVEAVARTVDKVREIVPKAIYCCDPVMGDVGRGVFVQPGIPQIMVERAIPRADIVTPNQFELELITRSRVGTMAEAVALARSVLAMGPKVALVTSFAAEGSPRGSISVLVVTADGAWTVTTPFLDFPVPLNGAGDMLAALFLGHTLKGLTVPDAASATVSGLFQVFTETHAAKSRELKIVACGTRFLAPGQVFPAVPVAL